MGQIGTKLRSGGGNRLMFWCPGCKAVHGVDDRWSFNGNGDTPTFSPSVLVQSGHYAEQHSGECWCTYEAQIGKPSPFKCARCHSFVTDGLIQFLSDSTHALAGQTVPLPDLPEHLRYAP